MVENTGPKYVYLIGDPVEHSVSPQMHNAAYKELGINYEYKLLKTASGDLMNTVGRMRDQNIAGFNVTVPYKEKIMEYLDYIDDSASIIGAVNAVKNENGKLKGYNTDSIGFIESLSRDAGFDPKGKRVLLLGAGGAAKAVAVALCKEEISEIAIKDIDTPKASAMAESLKKHFKNRVFVLSDDNALKQFMVNCDCIVNATPIGMYPKIDASPIKEDAPLREGQIVFDLVYNPAETKFAKMAAEKGAKAFTGLGMLVRQGAAAFELFTEKVPPVKTMWSAAEEALGIDR
ncbi:MAG: shikimate dehydrogenase [Candidatus Margulisiibacteriota bacterium]